MATSKYRDQYMEDTMTFSKVFAGAILLISFVVLMIVFNKKEKDPDA